MKEKIIEIVVMEFIAGIMFFFAYAIGIKQKMQLIAGYNERTAKYVKDKPGLAKLIGRLCLLVGMASALMPLATALWGNTVKGWALCVGHYGGFIWGVISLCFLQSKDYVLSADERKNA
jgi:hypothetical protein